MNSQEERVNHAPLKGFSITRHWRDANIATKLGVAFAIFMLVVLLGASLGYLSLMAVSSSTERAILASTEIQTIVLQMEARLEKARRLERDFFLRYKDEGFAVAKRKYAQAALQNIADVMKLSIKLKKKVAGTGVSDALREHNVNMYLYYSSADKFSVLMQEAVALVATLAAENTSLALQYALKSEELRTLITKTGDSDILHSLIKMNGLEESYFASRKRYIMQSAFNSACNIRKRIETTPDIDAQFKQHIYTTMEELRLIAEKILNVDNNIRNKILEFDLQAEAVDPVSKELLELASKEVQLSQVRIEKLRNSSTSILLVITLTGFALAVFVGRLLNRAITNNVLDLTHTARELRKGNLTARARITSDDELGQLGEAFNAMARQIQNELTELSKLNIALEAGEKRYRNVVEQAVDAIFVHTRDGYFIDVNNKACESLGYTREELLALCVKHVTTGMEDSDTWEMALQQVTHDKVLALESINRRKDGTTFPVEVHLGMMDMGEQDKDAPVLYIALARDISERKRTEADMEHLRALLKNIIDSMPSMLVGVDTHGCVTQWNKEAERATGHTAEHAIGLPLEQILPQLANEMDTVRQAIELGNVRQISMRSRVIEGMTYFEDITIYPLSSKQLKGAVIRIDDVTKRVRIEEMMVQTEKMMSVGGLAAGMAHEINNPLSAILSSVQNTTRRLAPDFAKNQSTAQECGVDLNNLDRYLEQRGIHTYLKNIHESGMRAARIVRNMLDFSRKSESQMAPHSINLLVDKALELVSSDYDLKKRYDFKSLTITKKFAEKLPDVRVSETEIEQVLVNLFKNATQAMSEKEYEQTQPELTVRTALENDLIRVDVEDNGPGLSPDVRKRIFEPFYTTKAPGVGTGLGLSVSYFIITQSHRGQFTVDSTPGNGTTFHILLPTSPTE